MFDRYDIQAGPTRVDVHEERHEYRAPTDESVRLLMDMEEAARRKLMAVLRLDNNLFKATVHIFRAPLEGKNKITIRYQLNGQDFDRTFDLDYTDDPRKMIEGIRRDLIVALSDIVTEEVVRQGCVEIMNLCGKS